MQVGTGGNAGAANIANKLTLGDRLSGRDNIIGHVHIDGREAIQVIDAYIVAGTACLVGGCGNFPCYQA